MEHAVDAGHDIHKGAEIFDRDDFAGVGFADFGFFDEGFNPLEGFLNSCAVGGGHSDEAGIVDVDRGAGFFGDFVDCFTTFADDGTDFVGVDHQFLDAGGVGAELFGGLGDDGEHVL